jgi:hypothetical protein
MNITDEIKKNHSHLSSSSLSFLNYAQSNPDLLKRTNFSPLKALDGIMTLQPWPTFIDTARKQEFAEVGTKLCSLIKQAPLRIFKNDTTKISNYYDMPQKVVEIQLDGVDHTHIENLLARGDFIISSEGLKCLEFNVTANLGGWPVVVGETLYQQTPVIQNFIKQQKVNIKPTPLLQVFFQHAIGCGLKKFPNSKEINCAIASPSHFGSDLQQLYKSVLKQIAPHLEGELSFCITKTLKEKEEFLYLDNKPVHVLCEMYHGLVTPTILKVFKAGNVCLFNGPVTSLLSNKYALALLSEHENSDLFSPQERELITKHIPWTRKMIPGENSYKGEPVKLETLVPAHREQLILKPSNSIAGTNVFIGKNTPQQKWEQICHQALTQKSWLVQEYVASVPYLYQFDEEGSVIHDAVWGFFVCGSTYAGLCVRVLPMANTSGVINDAQGAVTSIAFEVDN